MPVPVSITDLSTTPASNSPSGGEAPTAADDYLRTHAAFIAQLNANKLDKTGSVTPTANIPMGGYKHTGAGAATASGQYLVWGQAGNFSSLDTTQIGAAWQSSISIISNAGQVALGANAWYPVTDANINLGVAPSYRWGTLYCMSAIADTRVVSPLVFSGGASNLDLTAGGAVRIQNGTGIYLGAYSDAWAPATTGTASLGLDYQRWAGVYAATGSYTGAVTAASFSGAGTGLTGTAASLSIGGNAATASVASAATDYKSRALSSATRSSGTGEANTYASEVYDTGSNFDATTGRFTAPATGVYLVTWTAQANSGAGSLVASFARVNGSAPNMGAVTTLAESVGAGSVVVPLTAGQYVSIWMSVIGGLDCLINELTVTRLA